MVTQWLLYRSLMDFFLRKTANEVASRLLRAVTLLPLPDARTPFSFLGSLESSGISSPPWLVSTRKQRASHLPCSPCEHAAAAVFHQLHMSMRIPRLQGLSAQKSSLPPPATLHDGSGYVQMAGQVEERLGTSTPWQHPRLHTALPAGAGKRQEHTMKISEGSSYGFMMHCCTPNVCYSWWPNKISLPPPTLRCGGSCVWAFARSAV